MIYDPTDDALLPDKGKPITAKSPKKDRLRASARFVIDKISRGESLDKLPTRSRVLLPLADIYTYISLDSKLNTELIKAEQNRCLMIKEKMIRAINVYTKDPSPDNRDVFQAAQKAYESLAKSAPKQDAAVSINYYNNFPEDFWDQQSKDTGGTDERLS